ncbi:MAG TPA: alpha/beta hydrolase [Mycobacteriales bacterium]
MVLANSVELCAQTFGRRGDPAILLVSGGASMDWWEDGFCTALADRGRFVIRYDARDTGQSVHYPVGEPDYGSRELVGDAIGLLDAYGVGSACLMGISAGGALAQLAALDHPDRVRALVLVSTMAVGVDGPPMDPDLTAYFAGVTEPDWSDVDAVVASQVEYARVLAARSVAFDEAGMRALVRRALGRTIDVRAALTNPDLARDDRAPWASELGSLRLPTLVVHGEEDPFFRIDHGAALAAAIPGATLLRLPGVGHEFPRRVWPVVVPAVLEVSRG